MIRGFRVKALIVPKVLRVETSLEGLAKVGVFSVLKISQRKISFTRSLRGVVLITAMSKSRCSGPLRIFLPRLPKIVPPPETGYLPSIRPPSGTKGAGTNALVLKNSFTRLLTLPLRLTFARVAPEAKSPVVYRVAGPKSVPAALSKILNGRPD